MWIIIKVNGVSSPKSAILFDVESVIGPWYAITIDIMCLVFTCSFVTSDLKECGWVAWLVDFHVGGSVTHSPNEFCIFR